MNSLSISGKNWILKKFNQNELTYFKENFSLDEITSKLLSIRKIRKEEIKTFLNPSIKNLLPNPKILTDMDKSTRRVTEVYTKK
jgi:single-stranded-DNA-specific exonuclease